MTEQQEGAVHFCDLVMKGGVTSGVIYPRLVAALSGRYRFKNIGGTSAGAIAAGASAAAELGRQRGQVGAFDLLARLPEELGAEVPIGPTGRMGQRDGRGPSRSRLSTLFQPVPALRRHFDVLMGALGQPRGRAVLSVIGGMVAQHAWAMVAVAGVGALLLWPHARLLMAAADGVTLDGGSTLAVVSSVIGIAVGVALVAASGVALAAALFARGLLRGLRANGYGLCSGLTPPGSTGPSALTDWLHGYYNQLAGKSIDGPPLTFGELWGPDPLQRRIHLEVMTSAVSQQMVYSIPFRAGTPPFYYDPEEWARLFPPAVMGALAESGGDGGDGGEDGEPFARPRVENAQGRLLRPLPRHGELPVVVAIRMSLSFPLLLSAVPLYAVDWSRDGNQRTQAAARAVETDDERRQLRLRATRIWFSDGGIGSNMPLHLFDQMLPSHPTFAVNLKRPHPDHPIASEDASNAGGRIYLPGNDRGGRLRYWPEPDLVDGWERLAPNAREKAPAAGLASFLWSIVTTMQNWRDESQFPTPGFRDRIVQISQAAQEGGLNLAMPAGTIAALADAGTMAAQRLIARFHPAGEEGGLGWTHHRRARLTTFLGTMQPATVSLTAAVGRPADWLTLLETDTRYLRSSAMRDEAARFLTGLRDLGADTPMKRSGQSRLLDVGSLKPIPQVRLVPRI